MYLLGAAPLLAQTTYYVDAAAGSGGDGRSWSSAFRTIDAAAQAAGPGDAVLIRRGIYRETMHPRRSGDGPDRRVTYQAAPGDEGRVVVTGAGDVLGGWYQTTKAGRRVWAWDWPSDREWYDFSYRDYVSFAPYISRREVLIARSGRPVSGALASASDDVRDLWDGHLMIPVGRAEDLRSDSANVQMGLYGTFYVETVSGDGEGRPRRIYAAFYDPTGSTPGDPAQAQPRLAERAHGFWPSAHPESWLEACGSPIQPGYFAVKGILFRHTNDYPQRGVVCPGDAGTLLEDVVVEYGNGTGIKFGHGDADTGERHRLVNVRAQYNGQIGVGGACSDCVIEGGGVYYNNWKHYNRGWEAGGLKLAKTSRTVLRQFDAVGNQGPGLWLDIDNTDNVIEGCEVRGNWYAGIMIEYRTYNTLVQHNRITGTVRNDGYEGPGTSLTASDASGSGILGQTIRHTYLYWNTVVNNEGNGVYLRTDSRRDRIGNSTDPHTSTPFAGSYGRVYNNVIAGNATDPLRLFENGSGYEVQIEEQDGTAYEARTTTLGGNAILDRTDASRKHSLFLIWDRPSHFAGRTSSLDEFFSPSWMDQPDYTDQLLPDDGTDYAAVRVGGPDLEGTPFTGICSLPECEPVCHTSVGANPDAYQRRGFFDGVTRGTAGCDGAAPPPEPDPDPDPEPDPGAEPRLIGRADLAYVGTQRRDDWWDYRLPAGQLADPVAVMPTLSANDDAPATVHVRDIDGQGFRFQIAEWDYLDGTHAYNDDVPLLYVDRGTYELESGRLLQADATPSRIGEAWVSVALDAAFADRGVTPVVFAQAVAERGQRTVRARVRNVTPRGFEVRIQDQRAFSTAPAAETVTWVALEPGVSDGVEAGRSGDVVRHRWGRRRLAQTYADAPVFLAAMQTSDEDDPATVRFRNLTDRSVEGRLHEECSTPGQHDPATGACARKSQVHTTEDVGYAVLGVGDLYGTPLGAASAQRTALASAEAATYELLGTYPNPFADEAFVQFALPEAAHVTLTLYDVLGRRVAQPLDGPLGAGTHEARLDGRGLASGLYVYRLEAGDWSDSGRITVARATDTATDE